MAKRRWIAAVALLALAGCARPGHAAQAPGVSTDGMVRTAGCATATSPPAMSIDGTPQPANQNYLDGIAGRLEPYAQAHFADVYSGLELRSAQDRIRVYRKPSASFDAWVLGQFTTDCVELADARFAKAELSALVDRVAADFGYWRAKQVAVNTVSAKVDGSGVEVGTTDVARATRELPRRYGTSIPITVVYAAPANFQPGIAVTSPTPR